MTAPGSRSAFRVLALDGGGMRGLYTAIVLQRLATHFAGRQVSDHAPPDPGKAFDLIVGTSTGAILAAVLAAGRPLDRIVALYKSAGPLIFPSPSPIGARNILWCLLHWRRPSADADALRHALLAELGNETFGELYARRGIWLCLTASNLRTLTPRVFGTPSSARPADADASVVDACVASCAAPILFPPSALPVQSSGADPVLCDGGLWAGNPALLALLVALEACAPEQEIQLLSAGSAPLTGALQPDARPRKAGIGHWIRGLRLMQASLDVHAVATTDLTRRLAPHLSRRVRVARLLDTGLETGDTMAVRMDDPSPAALARTEGLAAQAADANARASQDPASELALLQEIFSCAPSSKTPQSLQAGGSS